jgi:hypothetical protein
MSHAYRANSAYLEKRVYPKFEQGKIQGKNNRQMKIYRAGGLN